MLKTIVVVKKHISNFKNKNFYQEINYKMFIKTAINHLNFEIESEEKAIEKEIEYELEEKM